MLDTMVPVAGPLVLFEIVAVVATFALFAGAVYLQGGLAGVRRHIPRLVLVALILVAGAVVGPTLSARLGGTTGLVVASAALLGSSLIRARRRQTGSVPASTSATR